MTVLILAHKRIQAIRMPIDTARILEIFSRSNRKGRISILFSVCIVFAVTVYISTMYASFNLGIGLRADVKKIAALEGKIAENIYRVHAAEGRLAESRTGVLESMEKVSGIKYLTPDRFAASYALLRP